MTNVKGEGVGQSDFDRQVKESHIFKIVQEEVVSAFDKWYHFRDLPALGESISFLDDEQFKNSLEEERVKNSVVISALMLSGVSEEEIFGQLDYRNLIAHASFIRKKIDFRQEDFKDLLSLDQKLHIFGSFILGTNLIYHNISLLPQKRIEKEREKDFTALIKSKLPSFFEEYSNLPAVSEEKFKGAREMMTYLFTEAEDPSRKIILHGAMIALALEYKGQEQTQLTLCEDINKGIANELSLRVEKTFVYNICDRLRINSEAGQIYLDLKKEGKTNEEKEEEKEALEFLKLLGIKTYTDEFKAYCESRIPLILSSRLSKKPQLINFI